jgi:threonine dehydratase
MAGTASLYLTCENLQKIGAFKARGACNKLLKLDPKVKTVCAHSSGNHAMALASMAKQLNLTAYVVMPEGSPPLKKRSVEGYGGHVIISGTTLAAREKACQ